MMRTIKAAVVAILFVLIPHQGPLAGPVEGAPAGPSPSDERLAKRVATDDTAAMRVDEGYVWSQDSDWRRAFDSSSGGVWTSDYLETDGYAWSTRAAEALPAFEPIP